LWLGGGFCGVWQRNCPILSYVLILALDTSSSAGSLAVLRDQKLIGTVSTWTEEIYSSRMFRHLEFLVHELSLGLADFDLFAVAAGPGSFTGLRVGLAAVKGWAEVYHKPVAAISALEAVAAQSHSLAPLLVPVLDARRGQIYFGIYRRAGAPKKERLALEGEECVMTSGELVEILQARHANSEFAIVTPEPALITGALSRLETARTSAPRISVEEVSGILAPQVGQLGYLRAQRGELVDSLTLDANYIRRSDAELHLKGPAGS
jgi:tRNA threonylcarbamoyladenosine biosynthesis protein TsaB